MTQLFLRDDKTAIATFIVVFCWKGTLASSRLIQVLFSTWDQTLLSPHTFMLQVRFSLQKRRATAKHDLYLPEINP